MPAKREEINTPLQYIKGVGPRRAEILAKEGILTPLDMLWYFPRAYIDRNGAASLRDLTQRLLREQESLIDNPLNELAFRNEYTVVAKVAGTDEKDFGRRKIFKLRIADGSGARAQIIFWNMAQYFKKTYTEGMTLAISGRPEFDRYGYLTFSHPEIDIIDPEEEELYRSGQILAKYRLTESMRQSGINMKLIRTIIRHALEHEIDNIKETLPDYILSEYGFPEIKESVINLHFPANAGIIQQARRRMKFEEIFYFELLLALKQRGIKTMERGLKLSTKSSLARRLYDALPFELTSDQKKVIREIASDLESGSPMNRLLQGDVGSGKTIVALLSMLMVVDNGCQVALMAPTEILAEQHFQTITSYLDGYGFVIDQLIGGQAAKSRREILERICSGTTNIIIGTHAMFESKIEYKRLGLVIIDEQHRFGVAQRAGLKELATKSFEGEQVTPHILVMTATPIPRTLSMTLYGDLDVSIIREMPKNRKPIKTTVTFESQLPQVHEFIRSEIKKGRQAYIVYPLVEDSEKLELKSATVHFEKLSAEIFPEFRCGLLHGQMSWKEKDEVMRNFLDRKFDIMIATTVIEVGIDIPNATIMLIENAERFGLSQLHQLRGRVGRGTEQSWCFLATKDHFQYQLNKKGGSEEERAANITRLKTMQETNDGFAISEVDLKLRGPGDMMGTRQSGLPDFKFTDLVSDGDIIAVARRKAFEIIDKDPHLRLPGNSVIREAYLKRQRNNENYFDIA